MIRSFKGGGKTVERAELQVTRGVSRVSGAMLKVRGGYNRMMEALGGGSRKAVEFRNSNKTFGERRALDRAQQNSRKAAEKANLAEKEFNELNEVRKQLKDPKISDLRDVVKARTSSRMALKEAQEAQRLENIAKNELNLASLKLVRKRGFNRLKKLGLLGALGVGGYQLYNSEDTNKEGESNYRWTPNDGWQQKDAQGNWGALQEEFGVDRFGNTNFYDADTGQWYSDYIQGSDGSVYDTQGNLLGNVMPKGGNFFDYNALQVAKQLGKNNLSAQDIMLLQQLLGVTADGLIGARTLNALAKQQGSPLNYFTIYS